MIRLGDFCAPLAAAPPEWLRRIPEGHQLFTLLTFAGWPPRSIVYLTFQSIERIFPTEPLRPVRQHRVYATAVAGTGVFPILGAALAQLYVFYVLPELGWVKLSWRANGVPVYLSFAFWKWITCFVLCAYTLFLSLAWSRTLIGSRNTMRDFKSPRPILNSIILVARGDGNRRLGGRGAKSKSRLGSPPRRKSSRGPRWRGTRTPHAR